MSVIYEHENPGRGEMTRHAQVSGCGQYRYQLWRRWSEGADGVIWVMLNPSTADALKDDPTIRKCIGFTKRWGYGAIWVVNLFGFRATKPSGLLEADDAIGPENPKALDLVMQCKGPVVAAWGANLPRFHVAHRVAVNKRLRAIGAKCLGTSKDGYPRHPLMLPYDTELEDL